MQQRRGVPRDGGVASHQTSYNYQNAQYHRYAQNGVQNQGAKTRHHQQHHDSKVYVGGLPHQATEGDLRARMSQFGNVIQTNIIYDEQGNSRGFGFVTFRNSEEAKSALGIIDMFGKSVEVKHSTKNSTAHQTDFRYRNSGGGYPGAERYPAQANGAPYSYHQPQVHFKQNEKEFGAEIEHFENSQHYDGYSKPSSQQGLTPQSISRSQLSPEKASSKTLSKKTLRKSSQTFEFQGNESDAQAVHSSSEKHPNISEGSTRYADSAENETTTKGNQAPHSLVQEVSSAGSVLSERLGTVGGLSMSNKRPEETHRTISKHSNPYTPPVASLPAVIPQNVPLSPSISPLDYNPHTFGIYFNPQQNLYTQPGMGFMMNQFMNYSPIYEPLPSTEPARHKASHHQEDSPSQPAVEMRINFYTFPGRV